MQDKNVTIYTTSVTSGGRCTIFPAGRCPRNKRLVGNFHTHPFEAETTPSIDDLLTAYARGVGCIGRSKTLDVMCINRKGEYNTTDFTTLLSVKNSIYTKEDIERLKNKFFDTMIFR